MTCSEGPGRERRRGEELPSGGARAPVPGWWLPALDPGCLRSGRGTSAQPGPPGPPDRDRSTAVHVYRPGRRTADPERAGRWPHLRQRPRRALPCPSGQCPVHPLQCTCPRARVRTGTGGRRSCLVTPWRGAAAGDAQRDDRALRYWYVRVVACCRPCREDRDGRGGVVLALSSRGLAGRTDGEDRGPSSSCLTPDKAP